MTNFKNDNCIAANGWVQPEFSVQSLRSGQELSELIHRLGHDIGNPLTAIISLGSVIQTLCASEQISGAETKFPNYAASIISEAWKISRINERLVCLLSARPGVPTACPLEDALSDVFTKLYHKDTTRFGAIDLEFSEDSQNISAWVDPAQLNLMLAELIINAVEATERLTAAAPNLSRNITVCARVDNNLACLFISALNPTATKSTLAQLFKPFVSDYPEEKHIGLGLTAAWAIAERFQGCLALKEEREGDAYRFTVKVGLPQAMK